jgi:hypothetical protein
MPPNNDGALICCRPGCSADVPAIRKWSLPVCQACLPKEKVRLRSLKRREKDRGEDFKDPEHRWYGQPGKFVRFLTPFYVTLVPTLRSAQAASLPYQWTPLHRPKLATPAI